MGSVRRSEIVDETVPRAAVWVALMALGVAALWETGANAQSAASGDARFASLEGRVLGIEGDDVIIATDDLAKARGLSEGDTLEIFRPIRLVHPVTRRTIVDRYRIGLLHLTQVRERIALGRTDGAPLRAPAVGDVVTMTRADAVPAPAGPTIPPASAGSSVPLPAAVAPRGNGKPGQSPDDAVVVSSIFESLRGASLFDRIRIYEKYAAEHETSPFARTLLEEAAALRELASVRSREAHAAPAAVHFRAPESTVDHAPLSVGIELRGEVTGAVLSSRNAGEVAYRAMPMQSAGRNYFVATIPRERVLGPALEYFVEATRPSGDAVLVTGTPDDPERTRVDRVPHVTPPLDHRSSVSVVTDYADYNRLRGNDRVFQTEGTFGMRFHDVGVRALRTGFGVYRGVGGSIEELDRQGMSPRDVGLTYGHIEGEFGLKPALSLIARAVVGLGEGGTSGGAQLHVRIGSDRNTNLTFGGEVLGGIGVRGITELSFQPMGRFPVLIRSEVTNQPAGARGSDPVRIAGRASGFTDVGVRAIVQVGYRPVEAFLVGIRGSYQGRTIDHSGPGAGAVLEYRW
jgi:hypothetical protein